MMVTSKFSRSKHAFRTPDVCKKKLPPGGEEEGAYPPPIVHFTYDVDVTWLWFNHVFSGINTLYIDDDPTGWSWYWHELEDPPADGVWCWFQHGWVGGMWNAGLQYFQGGLLVLAGYGTGIIELEPPEIHTGPFIIDFGAIWVGKRDGIVDS